MTLDEIPQAPSAPDCASAVLGSGLRPERTVPFELVRVRVIGPRYDEVRWIRLGSSNLYLFKVRRSGTYRVTSYYLGDAWRTRSVTRHESVPVRCRLAHP